MSRAEVEREAPVTTARLTSGSPAPSGPTSARSERHRRLARLARRQFGVVSVRQAAELGLSRSDLHRLVRDGHLVPRYRGVYAVNGAPDSREARWFAAQAALGPRAVLSHRTAASVHGLEHGLPADAVHLAVRYLRAADRPGIRLHAVGDLPDHQIRRVGPLLVTAPARTLCDVAGELVGAKDGHERLRVMVADAVRRGLADPATIRAAVQQRARFAGRTALRRVLDELSPLEQRTRSELESRFLQITTRAGVAPTGMNHPVRDGQGRPRVLDAVWLPTPVYAELDSRLHHGTWADRNDDIRRDNALALAGFTVGLRFTWQHVEDDPTWVVETVRQALASCTPGSG